MKKPIVGTDWRTDCIDNGNSIRVFLPHDATSFRAPALVICAPKTNAGATGKKAPSGKGDAVFEELFLFVRFGIEVIELLAVKGGLFIIVEGRDGNFSAAGAGPSSCPRALSSRSQAFLRRLRQVVFLALEIIADLFEHCFIDLLFESIL